MPSCSRTATQPNPASRRMRPSRDGSMSVSCHTSAPADLHERRNRRGWWRRGRGRRRRLRRRRRGRRGRCRRGRRRGREWAGEARPAHRLAGELCGEEQRADRHEHGADTGGAGRCEPREPVHRRRLATPSGPSSPARPLATPACLTDMRRRSPMYGRTARASPWMPRRVTSSGTASRPRTGRSARSMTPRTRSEPHTSWSIPAHGSSARR